jgi:hypothetical protein
MHYYVGQKGGFPFIGFVDKVIDYLKNNLNQTKTALTQEQIDGTIEWWED